VTRGPDSDKIKMDMMVKRRTHCRIGKNPRRSRRADVRGTPRGAGPAGKGELDLPLEAVRRTLAVGPRAGTRLAGRSAVAPEERERHFDKTTHFVSRARLTQRPGVVPSGRIGGPRARRALVRQPLDCRLSRRPAARSPSVHQVTSGLQHASGWAMVCWQGDQPADDSLSRR
jgi:hypothetical protein